MSMSSHADRNADLIRQQQHTVVELQEMARELAQTAEWPSSVINRMNKAELIELVFSAKNKKKVNPVEQATTLCKSNLVGTTQQLRSLARTAGIPNVGSMSKKQLCQELSRRQQQHMPVEDEDVDIPDIALDRITQEAMVDPVVASDGHSYEYTSLRNLFVMEQRRFERAGKPARKPVVVKSLFDLSITLENPFSDIPNLPKTFPLIRNKSLKQWIDEWQLEHGVEKDSSNANAEPIESDRDGGGFYNGIFVGVDDDEEDEEEEEVEEVEEVPLTRLMILADVPGDVHLAEVQSILASPEGTRESLKTDSDGLTAMMYAARAKNVDIVSLMLAHESSHDVARMQDVNGLTALMRAIYYSDEEGHNQMVIDFLLHESGRDVARMRDNNGQTALMWAVRYSRNDSTEQTVALLLAHESSHDVARMQNNDGDTALIWAARYSRRESTEETVAQLLAHESSRDVTRMQNNEGDTALTTAEDYSSTTSTARTVAQLLAYERSSRRVVRT